MKFDFVRCVVSEGHAPARGQCKSTPVVVPGATQAFLNISVKATEEQVLTVINGFGVDNWKLPRRMRPAGAGFTADGGESFVVKSLTITGNEDFVGLFLSGTADAFRSVRRSLGSLAAIVQMPILQVP